jgi:hypothetical protein
MTDPTPAWITTTRALRMVLDELAGLPLDRRCVGVLDDDLHCK